MSLERQDITIPDALTCVSATPPSVSCGVQPGPKSGGPAPPLTFLLTYPEVICR